MRPPVKKALSIPAAAILACLLAALTLAGKSSTDSKGINVASAREGAVAIADSEFGKFIAYNAIDGTALSPSQSADANRWCSAPGKPHPHWLWIRFRERARIEKVILHTASTNNAPVEIVGEYSPDGGVTFVDLFSVTSNQLRKQQKSEWSFAPKITDNFRLRILRSSGTREPDQAQLSEIEVFGEYMGKLPSPGPAGATVETMIAQSTFNPSSHEGLEINEHAYDVEFHSKWLRLTISKTTPMITELCWDSLGEGKVSDNLLKNVPDGGVRLNYEILFPKGFSSQQNNSSSPFKCEIDGNVVRYRQYLARGIPVLWEIYVDAKSFRMAATATVTGNTVVRKPVAFKMTFDPTRTPVAPMANPEPGESAPLPCLLHASDYGTLLAKSLGNSLSVKIEPTIKSSERWNAMLGQRLQPRDSDGLYEISAGLNTSAVEFTVEKIEPLSSITADDPRLQKLARSWLNVFQYRPELGILANNVLSDNAAFCMHTFTDPAVFTPELPGGILAIQLARESLDRYFNGAHGYGIGNENVQTDTNPSLLISAWDVLRVTGDKGLLRRWLPKLEDIAEKIVKQDSDGNGLPESSRTGIANHTVAPTGNWWDQINFGHEDAYVCALSYRAFRGMADLERLAGRKNESAHYEAQAAKIRAAYVPTFLNHKTGILAGWKDSCGALHDYWFLSINGMAISYGLVPDKLANSILDRFEEKLNQVGYTRFDLGLPCNLVPIPKSEYGAGSYGSPVKEDGSDTFGIFENGGATACNAYFYIKALYQMGRRSQAERILWPMMDSFAKGQFQNGIGHGGEWRQWNGKPSGYEGFLADAYYAQLALFTGHYGINFGPEGFKLEAWSPLKGKRVPLGLKYMGTTVKTVE